jgi:arginine transport system substrate-binding protein
VGSNTFYLTIGEKMFNYFRAILIILLGFTPYLSANDLIVGTTSAYAPFVSLNEQGEYVGFDIDVANEIGKKLNRQVVIKDLGSMPSLLLALKQNKVDMVIWAISKDRQKQMEMVYYQGEKVTSLPLLFWKNIPENISSLSDMANSPKSIIAVEAGSFQDSFLRSVPGLSLKQVDKVMDAILELKYGKSQATMIDPSLLAITTKQFPELIIMDVPLPESEQSFGNGICINRKNNSLAEDVRKAIGELREEGKIAELEKKWDLFGK